MTWALISVLIAFAIYLVYNGIAIKLFGIPYSLSDTFYLYKQKKEWMRIFFPIMMVLLVVFLMPAWLEISAASALQFLAFFASGGILFVGTAPAFMSSDLENKVHTYSAIGAVVFALLWVIFVSKAWFMIPIWFAVIALIAWLTKTWKSALIYWLENVAFMSTFTSIFIYFLI